MQFQNKRTNIWQVACANELRRCTEAARLFRYAFGQRLAHRSKGQPNSGPQAHAQLRGFYRLESVAVVIRVLAPGQSALRFSSFSSAQSSPPSALGIPEPPVAKGPLPLPAPAPDPPLPPDPPPDVARAREDPAGRPPGAPPPPDDPPLEPPGPATDDRSLSKNDWPLSLCLVPCRPPEAAMAFEVREVDRRSVMTGGVTAANLPQVFKNARRSSSSLPSRVTTLSSISNPLFTLYILNIFSTKNFSLSREAA